LLRYNTKTDHMNTSYYNMYSAVVCLKFKCSIDFNLSLLISKRTVYNIIQTDDPCQVYNT